MSDQSRRITLPVLGVSNTTAYVDTPSVVAPPGSLENVRPFDVDDQNRGRLATRPGWSDRFGMVFGDGAPIQGMGPFSRIETVSGYRLTNCESFLSRLGPDLRVLAPNGQLWMLNREFALQKQWLEDVTASGASDYGPDSAAANPGLSCVALSPDGTKLYIGSTYNDGSAQVVRVTCLQMSGNNSWPNMLDHTDTTEINAVVLWTRKVTASGSVFINQITATADYVFLASNEFVRILDVANGSDADQPTFNCGGWSQEVLATKLSADGAYLYVLFHGASYGHALDATVGNTSGAGVVVVAGRPAQHWRAGIMKCRIGTGSSVLTQVRWSTQLAASSAYFEGGDTGGGVYAPHGYLRFSEALNDDGTNPRGLFPTGMAICPDGGIVVSHANAAWGPTVNFAPEQPGASVSKFTSEGVLEWQADIPSFSEDRDVDHYSNDLPGDSSQTCSAHAIAVDAGGDIYVAGRINEPGADGVNAHKIGGAGTSLDGVVLWSVRLGDSASTADTMFENCVIVDPYDNQPIFCGTRATTWSGVVAAAPAHIWKRRAIDGGPLRAYDLGTSGITALGVAADGSGNVFYVTDYVS